MLHTYLVPANWVTKGVGAILAWVTGDQVSGHEGKLHNWPHIVLEQEIVHLSSAHTDTDIGRDTGTDTHKHRRTQQTQTQIQQTTSKPGV